MFHLPKIIYVLSYDRERVIEISGDTTKINPRYMEKIVQQEVKIPMIQKEQLEKVYRTCINNILMHYGVREDELSEYESLRNVICSNITELRKFKRMINSAFTSAFCLDNILYKRDLLKLEVIRFLEQELYNQIKDNKRFFISHDRIIDTTLTYEVFDKKSFNHDGKLFFEELFEKYEPYKNLLAEMFPYVKRFANKNDLESEYLYSNREYKEISRNARICSGKYFDLYFSYGQNEYLYISKEIEDIIGKSAYVKDKALIYQYMCDEISGIHSDNQREWFEQLENHLDSISLRIKPILAQSIFDCLDRINSSQVFRGLNARTRALLDIELLLETSELNAVQEFVENIKGKYGKLDAINNILYWFEHTRSEKTDDIKIREETIKQEFVKMCERVIDETINIYVAPYYFRYNIWGLVRYLKEKDNREEILHKYIANILNKATIFRFLGDMISQSIGGGYGYSIKEENLILFIEDESIVDSILEKVSPKTESEKFVLEVYQKYKGDEVDMFGEKQIMSQVEVEILL